MNRVILSGRLGNDPEIQELGNGNAVVNVSIATSKIYVKDGERQEVTDWHRCVAFGKMAEVISQHWRKGDKYLVEGELRTEEWTTDTGDKRSASKVYLSGFEFLTPKQTADYDPDVL